MATIVLVPGVGVGGWLWSRVAPQLQAAGHDVHSVTLSGLREEDRDADVSQVDLSTHVVDVVRMLEQEDLNDVVLVAHSYGGNVIRGVAERVPQRIARLVYLDAEIPTAGVSMFAAAGPEFEQSIRATAAAGGDPTRLPWFDDETLDAHFPGNEISAEDRAWLAAGAVSHPLATFGEALTLDNPAAAALPRTYVTCTRRMLPSPIGDDTPGWDHATLETGHWPMLTLPQETVALLDAIASGRPAAAA
ncbi:alpha/beta fold hydrolase [Conexibacter sp. CPCC 206217]|uniref:alpha/beta fold hydrolase n=1 Tax=Conexibacter sp. CPCC 206217 TaxID=3064574 RepID=UPI0027292D99|nr:alpha/beta hydrolase family protein [Conexibacter sp. CPCC 206217]MDO8210521.1 alpha/beta hydrolase family protein [Conexibacter sp. CPCC 206217]